MPLNSLNLFLRPRTLLIRARNVYLRLVSGIDIDLSVNASLASRIKPGSRGAIVIGAETIVAFKTLIYTFDAVRGIDLPVRVGRRCFIGGGSIITPGVTIGDESIVGAGSVVLADVASRTIVGGNPARVLRTDIEVGPYGRLKGADENSRLLWDSA